MTIVNQEENKSTEQCEKEIVNDNNGLSSDEKKEEDPKNINDNVQSSQDECASSSSSTSTPTPTPVEMPTTDIAEDSSNTMALNVAFEALEQVRQANINIEFGKQIDDSQCIFCLREEIETKRKEEINNRQNEMQQQQSRFSWKNVQNIRKAVVKNIKQKPLPCLTCGTPICYQHRSKDLFQHGDEYKHVPVCIHCSHLFSLEHLIDIVMNNDNSNKDPVNYMLDVYDRSLLILRYSAQYINDIIQALRDNTRRGNHIGLGSSATGIVSGITGVVAAGCIFTPVGPPLLIASILFGGAATGAAAGSDAVNYHCEPNKMADRIIAFHAIVSAISSLQRALVRTDSNRILVAVEEKEEEPLVEGEEENGQGQEQEGKPQDGEELKESGEETKENGETGEETKEKEEEAKEEETKEEEAKEEETKEEETKEKGKIPTINKQLPARTNSTNIKKKTNNSAKHWTRGTMTALRPLTAGALSAISIVTEAREMKLILNKIQAGNLCDKEDILKNIQSDMGKFPETNTLVDYVNTIMELRQKQQEQEQEQEQEDKKNQEE